MSQYLFVSIMTLLTPIPWVVVELKIFFINEKMTKQIKPHLVDLGLGHLICLHYLVDDTSKERE